MTTVRFPLPASLFPPMKVASDQAMQFASTCERIVDSTMAARHEYVHRYKRQLKPSSWQLVKRRVNETSDLAVYRPRRSAQIPRPAASVTASPILIGAGSLEGSLDEVMLGATSTNTTAMRFVTSTLHKDVADARVLTRIDTPNDVDPFAFLGFKWLVKTPSYKLPLARARDFIYIESAGVRELEDGSGRRVGYQLMHSVDLSCCPPLPFELGVVRGFTSFCFLFVETDDNCVEMFCKGFVDPRGGLSRRLTVSVAADMIMDCAKAAECAQRKKIEWTLREVTTTNSERVRDFDYVAADCEAILCESPSHSSVRNTFASSAPDQDLENDSPMLAAERCLHCQGGHRRRSTVTTWGQETVCGICSDRVCSHCSRRVRLPGSSNGETANCCLPCLDRAETIDAASFARELAQRAMAFAPQQRRGSERNAYDTLPHQKIRLVPIQKKSERVYAF